ncbi:MAG: hypothetical protein AAF213_09795, partial [Pseudomonadota bacterium]
MSKQPARLQANKPATGGQPTAEQPAIADDLVDEVEEEAAAAKPSDTTSEATYRDALDGFDPHLSDAKALSLEGGVRILRDLFPFQKPLFRADG